MPNQTILLQALAGVPRPAACLAFVNELLTGFQTQPETPNALDTLTVNQILIGPNGQGRIRANPKGLGIVIETLGKDGNYKTLIAGQDPLPQ